MNDFYDKLAPFYHLIFKDWNSSIARQGKQLAGLITSEWPESKTILDASCGIGTQALALAMEGYKVKGSDLSPGAVKRAKKEADLRQIDIDFSVCDMRDLSRHHKKHDIVLSADNSIPHLPTDEEITRALKQMYACLLPGGGCIITVRDYATEERGVNLVKPYGVRVAGDKRYLVFQVWDFEGDLYDLTFFFIEENLSTREVVSHTMRTQYYAISTTTLCELMREVGFHQVRRIDGAFYQPVLVGTRHE